MKLFSFAGTFAVLVLGVLGVPNYRFGADVECGILNEANSNPDIPSLGIVGGDEARPHEYPWTVGIWSVNNNIGEKWFCGGAIISKNHILTAAHCVKYFQYVTDTSTSSVEVGAHKKQSGKTFQIEQIIVHHNWNQTTLQDDIALIRLERPIDFAVMDKTARPVCLPTKAMDSTDFAGELATVVGWGRTTEAGDVSETLRKVQVPIVSFEECAKSYDSTHEWPSPIRKTQICAGNQEGGKDACKGDSGGPLTIVQNGKHYQLGVVSGGNGCAKAHFPGIYTRVTKYLDWIKANAR